MFWRDVGKAFHEGYFVADVVVAEFVDESASEHDSEASFADAEIVAEVEVTDRVFGAGCVWKVFGVESGASVADRQADRIGVDSIRDGKREVGVFAMSPFDRVSAHFENRLTEVFDLAFG